MRSLILLETFTHHSTRSPGFLAILGGGGAILLSLSVITAFGLGREFLMIREAGFASIVLVSFFASLMACYGSTSSTGSGWLSCVRVARVSRLKLGLVLSSLGATVAIWACCVLLPFFVASMYLFHNKLWAGLALAVLGTSCIIAPAWGKNRLIPLYVVPVAAVAISMIFIAGLADATSLYGSSILMFGSLAIAGMLAGFCHVLLPGFGGMALAAIAFVLANMRPSLASGAFRGVAQLLPDLGSINPAAVVCSRIELSGLDIGGSIVYCLILCLGMSSLAAAIEASRERLN